LCCSTRFHPGVFQGDRAYGWDENMRATRARGVRPQLARPQDDTHGSALGRTRWVVEGSLSWFNNHRRLRLCYDRSGESLLAFHQLAAVLICARKIVHRQAA
jgi:transposase